MLALRELGWEVQYLDIGEGFPSPSEATRSAARRLLLDVPAGRPIVLDGLALGVLPEVAAELAPSHPLLALVHHPLALEWGVSPEQADALRKSERAALAKVNQVVVTSQTTAGLVASDYGVPVGRITVARPGSDPVLHSEGSGSDVPHLLSVGAISPRKGFDVLIDALAPLTKLPWQLAIAGDLTRAAHEVARLRASIQKHDLAGRIELLGAVSSERLVNLYQHADLFVLASRFEGYGMAYAEALSHGLPVIGTTAGAIPDTVPPEAGILVPPGDVNALSNALRSVIADVDLRCRLSNSAMTAAKALPAWGASGAIFARVLEKLA
jgi:glycosyltransferase involved in cell wall biosynthesis